jgi:universal stress protein A
LYSEILVAVDFETDAAAIVGKAARLAALHGARLVLVHVTEPAAMSAAMIGPDGLGMVAEDAELDERLVEAARLRIAELARSAGLEDVEVRVDLGLPGATLVRVAEETGADLIVIGHHPRRGLAMLFGTGTDSSVLHHAPCDVLALWA